MQPLKSLSHRKPAAGFTLPAILVVVGALLILAVGILLVIGIERSTARSFADRQRAELAAKAGLEDIRGILTLEGGNDDFVVLQSTLVPADPAAIPKTQPAPHLFLARGKMQGTGYNYRYVPLFSTNTLPADNTTFVAPAVESLAGATNQYIEFSTLPYNDVVRATWLPVQDDKSRTVGRYAYWVEDLQSRVDPAIAGNELGGTGVHARAKWPFPAAGLTDVVDPTKPDLSEVALYAVDPTATAATQGTLGKTLIKNRKLLISPDSLLATAGMVPPLTRVKSSTDTEKIGELSNEIARAAEEGLVSDIRSYKEQPLVPFAAGIDPAQAGKPKLNLNKMLSKGGSAAVDEMGEFIRKALPKFETRKGGFPDDYAKTLAANALDYADKDSDSTVANGYRGVDAFPLVSEFLQKVRWDNIRTVNGRKFMDLSASVYVEVWNMTNQPVNGKMEISYETKYEFQIPPNPNPFRLNDFTYATTSLPIIDGTRYFPEIQVDLGPNEYRVYKCGTVQFAYDAVSSSEFISSPMSLSGELYGASGAGYKMRWNKKMVDQARGAIHRNDSSINYPTDTKASPRQRFRATIPSHSHSRGAFINNMGDPRMSFYNQSPQDANVYPQNFSPNRRNIRTGSIYTATNINTVYGRVLPSEWPDGGHDSAFGTDTVYGLVGMTDAAFKDEHRVEPDNVGFYKSLPYDYANATSLALAQKEAPTRISNLDRFYSATELGRIYDPVMWQVRATTDTTNTPGESWGDILTSSTSSGDYGGGNTLRIGRPEHQGFDKPETRATRLLDLFHTGISRSTDVAQREGNVVEIKGQVNINTAPKSALRMMLAGPLAQDPEIRKFLANSDSPGTKKYPQYSPITPVPDPIDISSRIADAIIRNRPYASTSDIAAVKEKDGTPLFGNPKLFDGLSGGVNGTNYPLMQWTDSAAEELFARVYEATTTRSRNYRIWVIGQAITPTTSTTATPEILSEVRKCYSVFADPGERNPDGTIDPKKINIKVTDENDF